VPLRAAHLRDPQSVLPNSSASYGMTIRDFVTLSVMYAIPVQGRDKDHVRVLRAESEDGEVQGPAICRKHTLT